LLTLQITCVLYAILWIEQDWQIDIVVVCAC
jgi:hypothetical protein